MKTFRGIVQKGKRRGHALGYPTVNIPLRDEGVSGIYSARVYLEGAKSYMAAAFADPLREILEAHLLDFSGDLYGMDIRIALYDKLRETADYADDASLKAAIAADIANVRKSFKN